MGRMWLGVVAATLLLAACGQSKTRVEQSRIDVYAMLSSLPADAKPLAAAIGAGQGAHQVKGA